jgi:hypothetical protein
MSPYKRQGSNDESVSFEFDPRFLSPRDTSGVHTRNSGSCHGNGTAFAHIAERRTAFLIRWQGAITVDRQGAQRHGAIQGHQCAIQ